MRRVLVMSAVVLAAAGADAAVNTNPKARLAAAAHVVRDIQAAIPREYWDKARCVAAFPELKNTEFVVGGKYGKGVMSCRTSYGWNTPAFVEIKKGARMFQVGAQQMDIVLLLMNEGAVQRVQQQAVTLGADASISPGPIDSQARVDLTTQRADILTYSRTKGLYMNLAGGVLRPDDDANGDVYGKGTTLRTILTGRGLPAPSEAQGFVAVLSSQPAAPVAVAPRRIEPSAAAPARLPAAFPRTTADDDLRARVVEMYQNVDRMLGDTVPAPVGTSGSVAPATVTIDRAQLLALRQQLDQILAALNRR
jgi:lipid-binding SYLF domain-containing protein